MSGIGMTEYVTGRFALRESVSGEVSLIYESGPGLTLSLMLRADYQSTVLAADLANVLNVGVAAVRVDRS
jgi:hypothetical protein